ncbi:enoyl-CoA hydratase/isomerase family protein [Thermodesulfobacteriota bacterium]
MNEPAVKLESKERVFVLTLNQPDKLNAMSEEMVELFRQTIKDLKDDPKPKALIVTGAGRAFSAGGNLKRMLNRTHLSPAQNKNSIFQFYSTFLSIMDLRIPTIAAINGHAIGAGACLCMACDMRLAASNAKIGFTFARIGLNPGMGAEYFLTRTVGRARTMELLMTAEILSADQALGMGLVNHVVPPEELMDKAMELGDRIASMPVLPIRMIKECVDDAMSGSLNDILHRQAAGQALCYTSEDLKEGIMANMEKRTPHFKDEY